MLKWGEILNCGILNGTSTVVSFSYSLHLWQIIAFPNSEISVSPGHRTTQPNSLCRLTDTPHFMYFVYTSKVIRYHKLTKAGVKRQYHKVLDYSSELWQLWCMHTGGQPELEQNRTTEQNGIFIETSWTRTVSTNPSYYSVQPLHIKYINSTLRVPSSNYCFLQSVHVTFLFPPLLLALNFSLGFPMYTWTCII